MKSLKIFVILIILFFGCEKDIPESEKTAKNLNNKPIKKIKVFIAHSYNKKHVCGEPQEIGIKEALEESEFELSYKSFHLQTKSKYVTHKQKKKQAQICIEMINEFQPDILFVTDDNAIKYVGMEFVDSDFFVVFSGMNGNPADYNKLNPFLDNKGIPNKNFTGVYEFLHSEKSINTMFKLFPETKKVLAIIDQTTTGKAVEQQLNLELNNVKFPFLLERRHISTMKEYKEIVSEINKTKEYGFIYNVALGLKDSEDQTIGVPQIFKYYLKNSKIPSVAVNYSFSKLGFFGGVAVDFQKMGFQAGKMGVKLLNGIPIQNIPIEDDKKYMMVFNSARAKQIGKVISPEVKLAADVIYDKMLLLPDYDKK